MGVGVGFGEGVDGLVAGAVVVVDVEVAAETRGLGSGVSPWAGVSFAREAVLL